MKDAFIIQKIEWSSGHSSVQQPTSTLGNPAPLEAREAPRARVQILRTESHIPEPAIHSHSLSRVDKMNCFKKVVETSPFPCLMYPDPNTSIFTAL